MSFHETVGTGSDVGREENVLVLSPGSLSRVSLQGLSPGTPSRVSLQGLSGLRLTHLPNSAHLPNSNFVTGFSRTAPLPDALFKEGTITSQVPKRAENIERTRRREREREPNQRPLREWRCSGRTIARRHYGRGLSPGYGHGFSARSSKCRSWGWRMRGSRALSMRSRASRCSNIQCRPLGSRCERSRSGASLSNAGTWEDSRVLDPCGSGILAVLMCVLSIEYWNAGSLSLSLATRYFR